MSEWWDREPTYGDVVRRRGKWVTLAPTHCPQGHELGPNQVLVGHVACTGHGGGGHMTWFCRRCPQDAEPIFGPPLGSHCSALEGPAPHRLEYRGSRDSGDSGEGE